MRTTVRLSISCRKNVFLLKFSNKNTFFPNEMDKLTVVLMFIKRLNKERRPFGEPLSRKLRQTKCLLTKLTKTPILTNYQVPNDLF